MQGDEGDDDVFLVVEVAQQGRGDDVEDVGQPVGVFGGIESLGADGLMQAHATVEQGFEMGVDRFVVAIQQIEAGDEPILTTMRSAAAMAVAAMGGSERVKGPSLLVFP